MKDDRGATANRWPSLLRSRLPTSSHRPTSEIEAFMRAIQYASPRSIDDAIVLLQEAGGRARILAGGTDLIVQVGANGREVDLFVDGKQIPELMTMEFSPDDGLTLGAAVPCFMIYESEIVRQYYPALVDAVSIIGGTA